MVATATPNTQMAKKSPNKKSPKSAGKSTTPKLAMLENSPELKHTVAAIEKQFGDGAIMPLGSDADRRIEGISTGSLSVDMALGGQGIPRGRIIEVFGPESSGKTTLALHVVAECSEPAALLPSLMPSMP